jgi:sortase A
VAVGWHEEMVEGVNMVVWDVADFAAGWHKTTARPGEGGNIVLTGHHNIKGEVFRDIVTLEVGAEVTVYVDDIATTYYVTNTMILPEKGMPLEVRRENARWIEPTDGERVTLVTCWPYNNNTHRVVVIAEP